MPFKHFYQLFLSIKWGKQKKRQRFKCKDCGILFTSKNEAVKLSNQFSWFKKWVISRRTIRDLVTESGYSERTLRRLFYSSISI